jgi:uncharacterized protein
MTLIRNDRGVLSSDISPERMVIARPDERASAIITESIPPERRDEYLRWVRAVNQAAESFRGYRGTNVFPPSGEEGREWVTIIQFNTRADLDLWLTSDVRAGFVNEFRREFGEFGLHQIRGGLSPWFAQQQVPDWKMALTVLLGVYPTVMLVSLFISPRLGFLPLAFTVLLTNALVVSALQWILMPGCNRLLAFWLKPTTQMDRRSDLVGSLAVIGLILASLGLFLAWEWHG